MKVVLYLLLIGTSVYAEYPDAAIDEYWAARIIEGEGVYLTSNPELAAQYLLDTVRNRIDAGWCHSIKQCAKSAYWGIRRVRYPKESSILMARRILGRPYKRRLDAFYAFSGTDITKLNLASKDATAIVSGENPLYFYDRDTDVRQNDPESDGRIKTKGSGD